MDIQLCKENIFHPASNYNIADLLTRSLSRPQLVHLPQLSGMVDRGDESLGQNASKEMLQDWDGFLGQGSIGFRDSKTTTSCSHSCKMICVWWIT